METRHHEGQIDAQGENRPRHDSQNPKLQGRYCHIGFFVAKHAHHRRNWYQQQGGYRHGFQGIFLVTFLNQFAGVSSATEQFEQTGVGPRPEVLGKAIGHHRH